MQAHSSEDLLGPVFALSRVLEQAYPLDPGAQIQVSLDIPSASPVDLDTSQGCPGFSS